MDWDLELVLLLLLQLSCICNFFEQGTGGFNHSQVICCRGRFNDDNAMSKYPGT